MMVQRVVRVGGGLVRGRGHGVPLCGGAPLQHGRRAIRRAEPYHQRPVCVRADADSAPQRFTLCQQKGEKFKIGTRFLF